ncbi:mucin-5AC-like [Daphnia pulex]|uniref:mucin-5AC-like n=1 Tax=Daphnia pulex TaxID=6669 RepID=UPI001EDFB4D0|nr:mucin-5AC-like [Daphnia pulex]
MDSRHIAILVLAIFISTVALASGVDVTVAAPPSTNTSVAANTATTAPSTSIKDTNVHAVGSDPSAIESVLPIEPASSTGKLNKTTESSATSSTTAALNGETTKEVVLTTLKPTEVSTASTSAAPTSSSTDSTKSTQIVNDHAIRDVSSEKCSAAYNAANKVNWVPEKAILAVLEGNAVVTVDLLCEQWDVIKQLDANCTNTKVKLDADDIKVAPIVAGLNSMFSAICSDKKTFNVPAGNSIPCVELIQSTTKNCSTNSLAKAVFPTEVLLEEMVKEDCTVVLKTKECFISGLGQSDKCTERQREAVKKAINMVTQGLPCSLPISTEKTPDASTEAPSVTTTTSPTTTTTPPTTTTPTVTTTKSHSHSSANGFQVNFFTVLPVLLLVFKFY